MNLKASIVNLKSRHIEVHRSTKNDGGRGRGHRIGYACPEVARRLPLLTSRQLVELARVIEQADFIGGLTASRPTEVVQ